MNTQTLHKELKFRTSRSSGAGGQHVNKVSTKVELLFDIKASLSLTEEEKEKIKKELSSRINKQGILTISSENSRSQLLNKNNAIKKFNKLIAAALSKEEVERDAGAFVADKRKRLNYKKKHAEKKSMRKKVSIYTNH
ncbi:MAG: alternative ribosome rescue aminoacyl-tRNA hydrolase ArfB [Bacteroidota bacterium]